MGEVSWLSMSGIRSTGHSLVLAKHGSLLHLSDQDIGHTGCYEYSKNGDHNGNRDAFGASIIMFPVCAVVFRVHCTICKIWQKTFGTTEVSDVQEHQCGWQHPHPGEVQIGMEDTMNLQ